MAHAPFERDRYRADSGDIGGDNSVGVSPSRSFAQQRDDGTYTVITEYASAYLADAEKRPRVYDVQNVTEVMHCRDLEDIGGTEIDCDYTYEFVNVIGLRTIRKAESHARKFIRSLDINHYGWEEVTA